MKHPLQHLVYGTLLAALATPPAVWAEANAAPISGVIGKLQSFTGSSLDVMTSSGAVHIAVKEPLTTYKQIPSDLSHVATAPYIGVASTEQADGKQVAKQIFIFPVELRGAAEGSVLTDPPGAISHSRMTNGTVSRPSHSRMTNGTVQKSGGTSNAPSFRLQESASPGLCWSLDTDHHRSPRTRPRELAPRVQGSPPASAQP